MHGKNFFIIQRSQVSIHLILSLCMLFIVLIYKMLDMFDCLAMQIESSRTRALSFSKFFIMFALNVITFTTEMIIESGEREVLRLWRC